MVAGPDGENVEPVKTDADRQRLHGDAGFQIAAKTGGTIKNGIVDG